MHIKIENAKARLKELFNKHITNFKQSKVEQQKNSLLLILAGIIVLQILTPLLILVLKVLLPLSLYVILILGIIYVVKNRIDEV